MLSLSTILQPTSLSLFILQASFATTSICPINDLIHDKSFLDDCMALSEEYGEKKAEEVAQVVAEIEDEGMELVAS